MNESLTQEEIRRHQHPLLPDPSEYRVLRYVVEVDPDRQAVTCIVLTLRAISGELRHLRFLAPRLPEFGPFQIPLGLLTGPVYVVDTSFRGWENQVRIEVGSLVEDKPTFFYAERVEEMG